MHRDIIVSAFAKAKKEAFEEHGIQVSTNKAAERISEFISVNCKVPFGAKSLRLLHSKTKDASESVEIKQPQVVVALCNYLAYDSYEAYALSKNGRQEIESKPAVPSGSKEFYIHAQMAFVYLPFYPHRQRHLFYDQQTTLDDLGPNALYRSSL